MMEQAIVAGILVVALCAVCLTVTAGYLLFQVGKHWKAAREAQFEGPPPRERPPDGADDPIMLRELGDFNDRQNERVRSEWAEEKLAEGWDEEDIETFLKDRPLLEMN